MEVVERQKQEQETAQRFINFLYEPEDIFEVRVRYDDRGHVNSVYVTPDKRGQFLVSHLPIHYDRKGHVWVGVGPREKVGSTNPALNRVLWCDFDKSVHDETTLHEALEKSGLPPPTMTVNSGNGFHAYWKLEDPLDPTETRKYSKALHARLPTDATHDPTRVMRLPGTWNFKDPENPKYVDIHELHPDRVYDISAFPKMEMSIGEDPIERKAKQLDGKTFDQFLAAYVDGQKHSLSIPIIGYLRKERFFSRTDAMDAMKALHVAAGHEWPNDGLRKNVNDTYDRPLSSVVGRSGLYDFGIVPVEEKIFELALPTPKKAKIQLIDFNEHIEEQKFWVDGIVGPGLLTLWAAAPKSGKSFCVMQMGYAISKGLPLWGMTVPEPKKVLYFQGELSRGMVYARAISMFGRHNIPHVTQYAMTDKPDETLTINRDPEVLLDLAENYDVIIIDPLSAFNGNDENDHMHVRETLGIFDSLKAQGKAVVLVHHTRKATQNKDGSTPIPSAADARGSGMWVSAADAIVMQQKTGDGNAKLYFTLRAAPDRDPLSLYRLPNGSFTSDRNEYLQTNPVASRMTFNMAN